MQHKWEIWVACDAIWHRRTLSTLVQVLACCPITLSHFLNQYWYILTSLWLCGIQPTFLQKMFILAIIELCLKVWHLKWQPHIPGTNEHGNTLRLRQNGRHFPDDIFKCFFLNGNVSIAIKISLKFVLKGPINNSSALVQIMAWRRPGDKPLSKPMMVRLPTHICVTRPQWINCWKTFMELLSWGRHQGHQKYSGMQPPSTPEHISCRKGSHLLCYLSLEEIW